MTGGIRATVAFPTSAPCPIAEVSSEADARITDAWTSVAGEGPTPSVTEFVVEAETPPAGHSTRHVMSIGNRHVLRFDHGREVDCPCAHLGRHGCPVQRYVADSGSLELVFNAGDFSELQAVMRELNERFPDLDVRRLVRSPDREGSSDPVFVDRGRLTGRQIEVLQTAYRMGYFDRPRRANATEVAATLDIDPSTLAEHLAAAQRKVLGDVLGERPS